MPSEKNGALASTNLIGTTRFEPRADIKNILITGGMGFIGGWVTRHLTMHYPEYTIICIDKMSLVSSPANIHCLATYPNFHFVEGDLIDQATVSQVLSEYNIDCVLHFAACSHVQNSFVDPAAFTLNNVVATQQLLDAIRLHEGASPVRRFIHISTDEVYGETVDGFVDETTQFIPTNPYAASKAAAEMYVWAYAKSFGIPALVVRSNNVFGPGQYPEKLIPRFCTLLGMQQSLTIQGSGLHVRRYLYAEDATDALDTLLHKGTVGEAYNLSASSGVTNLEVAVRMLQLHGYTPADFKNHLVWIPDRPFNDHDYRIDGSKLEALGWRQRTSFPEGLAMTMDWYRKNTQVWWPDVERAMSLSSTVTACEGDSDGGGGRNGCKDNDQTK
ncbi:dTDP-D-glucose 4,6-dehydratase-like protein [Aspergillus pseudoustus]|uniref:dTDP-D-glucose 4,6-dehydratase-like protein n=1 Tax=Aspergillus pseudoustus TaxID=1810923 RepID=A0ABR4IQU6_9EURO